MTNNQIADKKRLFLDELLKRGFSAVPKSVGHIEKDYMRLDVTDKLSFKCKILGKHGVWKGEFEGYYSSIWFDGFLHIAAVMNSEMGENNH